MDRAEEDELELALQSDLGPGGAFVRYERSEPNAMTAVLELAEWRAGTPVRLLLIGDHVPVHFFRSGFSEAVVGYSLRYVQVSHRLRQLLTEPLLDDVREEAAERLFLRTIAECALQQGNTALALKAFAESVLGDPLPVIDSPLQLLDLSESPVDEAFVAHWFYGLLHEVGHFAPVFPHQEQMVSDEALLRAMRPPPGVPNAALLTEAIAIARTDRSHPFLRLDLLRAEVLADICATELTWLAARRLMQQEQREFRPVQLAAELRAFFEVLALVQRCGLTAAAAARFGPATIDLVRFHAVAVGVRVSYFSSLATALLDQGLGGASGARVLRDIERDMARALEALRRGMTQAIRALFTERSADPVTRLAAGMGSPIVRMQIEHLLDLTSRLGVESDDLARLAAVEQ